MPDVGTPQTTWRDAPELTGYLPRSSFAWSAMEAAVAARDREVAATLRAKIEALPTWERLKFLGAWDRGADQFKRDVLAVLDAVWGGDS